MRPDWTQVRPEPDGTLSDRYTWCGQALLLDEADVLHVKGFTLDGQIGLSTIDAARQSFGTAMAAEEAAGSIFKNGMRPSGYLKTAAGAYLTQPQREQAQGIIERYKGFHNTGEVPLLEGEWSFESLSGNRSAPLDCARTNHRTGGLQDA